MLISGWTRESGRFDPFWVRPGASGRDLGATLRSNATNRESDRKTAQVKGPRQTPWPHPKYQQRANNGQTRSKTRRSKRGGIVPAGAKPCPRRPHRRLWPGPARHHRHHSAPPLPSADVYPGRAMALPRVVAVAPGSPADRAGVLPGDELVALDGQLPRDIIEFSCWQTRRALAWR